VSFILQNLRDKMMVPPMNTLPKCLFAISVMILAAWLATKAVGRRQDNRILDRRADGGQFSIEILSSPYDLDRVYKSMMGPRSNHGGIRLVENLPDDATLWLTGIQTQVVEADRLEPISNEFFCHSNLTLNPETTSPDMHNQSFGNTTYADWRLFTLIPGRLSVQLPAGCGVPIKNGTLVDYFSMTLNQNPGYPARKVRLRTLISGRHGAAAAKTMQPLFRRALYVYQQHIPTEQKTAPKIASVPATKHQGALCAEDCQKLQVGKTPSWSGQKVTGNQPVHPGATCCVANASKDGVINQFGAHNTVHWMVPPGQHVYRTEVTEQMQLPRDTKVYYATGHLHPFGKTMRLIDMEHEEVVCEILSESFDDRLGVAHMSEISSSKGIPIHRGRRYELIAEYDNRLNEPIDAMAILYLYAATQPQDVAASLVSSKIE
jgi:hypothetical protein